MKRKKKRNISGNEIIKELKGNNVRKKETEELNERRMK